MKQTHTASHLSSQETGSDWVTKKKKNNYNYALTSDLIERYGQGQKLRGKQGGDHRPEVWGQGRGRQRESEGVPKNASQNSRD